MKEEEEEEEGLLGKGRTNCLMYGTHCFYSRYHEFFCLWQLASLVQFRGVGISEEEREREREISDIEGTQLSCLRAFFRVDMGLRYSASSSASSSALFLSIFLCRRWW